MTVHVVSGCETQPRAGGRDVRIVASLSFLLALVALAFFLRRDALLTYPDAVSHLEIARRVVDSPTSGFSQLGGVWLPLPHLLAAVLVWVEPLYFSGLAGSAVSVVSYILTAVLLYKVVVELTGHRSGGYAATIVFALNPNVLYMQSTPMTELLLFACLTAMVYFVQRWAVSGDYRSLLVAAAASIAATLTRYEAWVLLATMTLVVAVIAWRRRNGYIEFEGLTLTFVIVAWTGIFLWLGWNLMLFGDVLYFHAGEYAKPSLWVSEDETSVGNWSAAVATYFFAVKANVWPLVSFLALVGVATIVIRERLSDRSLPSLALLVWFPFFVVALENGQRPLHVPEISDGLYNVRFGLVMILPAAIFAGYLAGVPRSGLARKAVSASIVVIAASTAAWAFMSPERISTYREPLEAAAGSEIRSASDGASRFLDREYSSGRILREVHGNEMLLFRAEVTTGPNVYEGSYREWSSALRDPLGADIEWIVMRHGDFPDKVYEELWGSSAIRDYELVYENEHYFVFRRGL
jgi:hypothetical protein